MPETPNNTVEVLPPADILEAPVTIDAEPRGLFSRRSLFKLGGVATIVAITAELSSGRPTGANADSSAQPADPPTPEDPTVRDAQLKDLESKTKLQDEQRESLKKSWLDEIADFVGGVAGPLGIVGVALGGAKLVAERVATRKNTEDENFRRTIDGIKEELRDINSKPPSDQPGHYVGLLLSYAQLDMFADRQRFVKPIYLTSTAALRARPQVRDIPAAVNARVNADRGAYELLCTVAPKLPRKRVEGKLILPNLKGIVLNGIRYLRNPLERVSLEGAWLQDLVITGSLAGSDLKLARLHGSTFGEQDNVCDLRGTDLSQAELEDAHFAYVKIDEHTKFGAGKVNPCSTFGKVTSDTLKPDHIQQKLAEAKAVIDAWKKAHPS